MLLIIQQISPTNNSQPHQQHNNEPTNKFPPGKIYRKLEITTTIPIRHTIREFVCVVYPSIQQLVGMSYYVTPFLVLNLGAEMVFVVAQRLQAQNITIDKTNLVLDEIISVLISKQLMNEIMKPQATYNHEAVRDIIEDVTQSSCMRLDTISMGKLWDLITMVFKWQISVCNDIIKITLRHLYEIENYITNPNTQTQLHKVQNFIDNFNKILTKQEKHDLHNNIEYWLKDYQIRVSLLLRMGLQRIDGTFELENLNPIASEMLKNIGENIYAVTDNGRILEKHPIKHVEDNQNDMQELQLFVDQIGQTNNNNATNQRVLRLLINDPNANCSTNTIDKIEFDRINLERREFDKIGDEIDNCDNTEEGCLTDDLLEMITSDK